MLKKTITYTDYNGTERTEDFYFNLTQTEVLQLELGTDGGLVESLTKIVNSKDAPKIMEAFNEIINKAYGEKSDDGRRIMKSPEITRSFLETEAYNILFMELFGSDDTNAAANFINEIIPKKALNNKVTSFQQTQTN